MGASSGKVQRILEKAWGGWRRGPSALGATRNRFILGLQTQSHWDWRVALYLYGAGTSAGLIFVEVLLRAMDIISEDAGLLGMWIGMALALIALTVLFDHLGPHARWKFWYAIRNPRTSWISRGFLIVTVLIGLRLVILLPTLPGLSELPWAEGSTAGNVLRGLVLLFALAFMAYSGLVLSSWNAIAFWNTPLLPVLYVGCSFLGGIAGVFPVVAIADGTYVMAVTAKVLNPWVLGLLLGNGFGLLLYVWGMTTSTRAARESVRLLIRTRCAPSFWIGVVAVGFILPMLVSTVVLTGVNQTDLVSKVLILGASSSILIGTYILRDNILRVGVYGPPI